MSSATGSLLGWAPSLSGGAGIGHWLGALLPGVPADAVVLLGMVAYFAGVVQAPITAGVIVLEMTGNHAMAVPLMVNVAEHDSVARARRTLRHLRKAPAADVRSYPAGHFDIYQGAMFEKVVADQTAFLTRYLRP